MVWIIHTPTSEQGGKIASLPPNEWQVQFEEAYRRGNYVMLDWLGIDTHQLPHPIGWGTALVERAKENNNV